MPFNRSLSFSWWSPSFSLEGSLVLLSIFEDKLLKSRTARVYLDKQLTNIAPRKHALTKSVVSNKHILFIFLARVALQQLHTVFLQKSIWLFNFLYAPLTLQKLQTVMFQNPMFSACRSYNTCKQLFFKHKSRTAQYHLGKS